ncbi:hypothetical protein HMPREF1981_03115 [Bacteroides pyogenes F0041]|uniref:Uncharacterized protein n=1 Tax=Bacteroides pyogenes F0041 TaxID=1321819 RepID=U2CAL1_9BACE|nr:hypothetical protein HMPREF1981_03115 [Bacteroides pyogenes F0041]
MPETLSRQNRHRGKEIGEAGNKDKLINKSTNLLSLLCKY